jgi:NhaP-type Na+/H+ or K+/H+ antiporter
MSFERWLLVMGGLLLLMALTGRVVQRLPITTTLIYLLLGVALGPLWQDAIRVDPILDAPWLHRAAEISVIISLFTVGLKLRLPLNDRRLRPAICLAFASMVLTVGLITGAGVWLLGLPLGAAVLLGAILAPTDPVLASDVQTKDPHDRDKLRLTLTAEAGFNDGTAFPFVMLGLGLLGLHDLGEDGARWWLVDVLWAVVGGLGLGGALGAGIGWLVMRLHARKRALVTIGEYLILGLIGVSYGLAIELHVYGFLSVFAAGVGLRTIERIATARQFPDRPSVSVEQLAAAKAPPNDPAAAPAYFAGALLATNEQLERMLEVALVLLVGAVLFTAGFAWDALWFAPLLFLLVRPIAALPVLLCGRFSRFEFSMVAWFGIRGIGSIYYLMYAVDKGLPAGIAERLVSLTVTTVALSIVLHGVSVTPLLNRYHRLTGQARG